MLAEQVTLEPEHGKPSLVSLFAFQLVLVGVGLCLLGLLLFGVPLIVVGLIVLLAPRT